MRPAANGSFWTGVIADKDKESGKQYFFSGSFLRKIIGDGEKKYITYAPYLLFIQHTVYMQSDKSLQICEIKMKTPKKNTKKLLILAKLCAKMQNIRTNVAELLQLCFTIK